MEVECILNLTFILKNVPFKHGGGEVECPTTKKTLFLQNMSNIFLKIDKCILSTKDNPYGERATPVIEITFENDYIHL